MNSEIKKIKKYGRKNSVSMPLPQQDEFGDGENRHRIYFRHLCLNAASAAR